MTTIEMLFKDTGKWIKVDLSKNNALYGINGRGKTRVLKAIQSLHELVKQNNFKDITSILESLNMENLIINGTNYKSLFLNFDEMSNHIDKELFLYINENLDAITFLHDRINTLSRQYSNYLSMIEERKIKVIQTKLSFALSKQSVSRTRRLSTNDFIEMLNDVEFLAERIKRLSKDIDTISSKGYERVERLIFDVMDVQSFLKQRLNIIYFNNSELTEVNREHLSNQKKNILSKLRNSTVYYFSIDFDENCLIFDIIRETINKINQSVLDEYWRLGESRSNRTLIDKMNLKIHNFNKVIKKYENIELLIDINGHCTFLKNNDHLEFSKFSSGEKRLITLFLSVIFSDSQIMLIDEPELSLSLNYQSKLVLDLMTISNGKNLIIATHAPFIFDDFTSNEKSIIVEV